MHLCITSPVPIYSEIYPNYENSHDQLKFHHEFYDEKLGKLALDVAHMKTFVKYGHRIFPGIYKDYTGKYNIQYFYKTGYKEYRHFETVEECVNCILMTICKWEEYYAGLL